MNNLSHMLTEALTAFKCINGPKNRYVKLNFFLGDTIGADTEKHRDQNVEVIVEDRDVKLSNRVNCFACSF
jgi:hypothetical protein